MNESSNAGQQQEPRPPGRMTGLLLFIIALVLTLVAFYALNHGVMNMQGLPLNWDLTPAQ